MTTKWMKMVEEWKQRRMREHVFVDYTKYLKEEEE